MPSCSAKPRARRRTGQSRCTTAGRLTYRQLDQASDRLAASLAAAGIVPGDRIALQLPSIPQFLISYFGILKAGAVVVTLNHRAR